jgi:hypothetical protein
MSKEIKVQLTLEWSFTERDWSKEQKHIKDLKEDGNVVLGYDTINALFMLNELDRPELKNCKVTAV